MPDFGKLQMFAVEMSGALLCGVENGRDSAATDRIIEHGIHPAHCGSCHKDGRRSALAIAGKCRVARL
jgi:hypothetical protein